MEIKPKMRGWKEGILKQDLNAIGGYGHKKGDTVRYKRYRVYDPDTMCSTNEYEWHYINQQNYNLVRTREFLIQEK